MSSRHLPVRLDSSTFEGLDTERQRTGESRSQVAKRLLDEGLRMAAHPGVVFRSGPAGRRPGLAGGPDVWEVVRLVQGLAPVDDRIERAVESSGLGPVQVRAARGYYAEYAREIDAWLRRVASSSTRAEARWHHERSLFGA